MSFSDELLSGLSEAELTALADGLLVPRAQNRMDNLLQRNADGKLTAEEAVELDSLLARVDQLNLLKTRARFTLRQHAAGTSGN